MSITGLSGCINREKLQRIIQVRILKNGCWLYLWSGSINRVFLWENVLAFHWDKKSGSNCINKVIVRWGSTALVHSNHWNYTIKQIENEHTQSHHLGSTVEPQHFKKCLAIRHTVQPPVATTSRKRPPLLSDQFSKITNISQWNHYIWNLL